MGYAFLGTQKTEKMGSNKTAKQQSRNAAGFRAAMGCPGRLRQWQRRTRAGDAANRWPKALPH
jgi:hypothetical protein